MPIALSWIKNNDRDTYESIIEADSSGMEKFSGHGCAIAQITIIYNASCPGNRQIHTGKVGNSDFIANFKRQPGCGFRDSSRLYTLEILADCGIKFTTFSAPGSQHKKISARGGLMFRAAK